LPRSLTIQRSTVPSSEREKYLDSLKSRRAHYLASSCRFWVFEEAALQGAFIEFTEADEEAALAAAHESAPHRVLDPTRIYREVEF
jgi:hypothetical protein